MAGPPRLGIWLAVARHQPSGVSEFRPNAPYSKTDGAVVSGSGSLTSTTTAATGDGPVRIRPELREDQAVSSGTRTSTATGLYAQIGLPGLPVESSSHRQRLEYFLRIPLQRENRLPTGSTPKQLDVTTFSFPAETRLLNRNQYTLGGQLLPLCLKHPEISPTRSTSEVHQVFA